MNVLLNTLPDTLDKFKAMPQMDQTKPENVCAMLLCALNLYLKDQNAGVEALNLLRGPRPMNGYDTQFLRDRLRGKTYLPLAYCAGATPENSYAPHAPYELDVLPDPTGQPVGDGYLKVFLKTAGADSPRPVTLRRKGEDWCLWEYSSILSGIRTPKAEDPWA